MWLMRKNQCMHCAEPGAWRPARPTAPSCNTPTASWIFSRTTASGCVLRHRLPIQYSENRLMFIVDAPKKVFAVFDVLLESWCGSRIS